MQDQSSGFTMIPGGVVRSDAYRRDAGAGRRSTVALLVVIAALLGATGWLAGVVATPQAVDSGSAPDTTIYPY